MENNNHQFMHRVLSGFLPTSFTCCQYRNTSDVVENSILINPKNTLKIHGISRAPLSSRNKHKKLQPFVSKSDTLLTNSEFLKESKPQTLFLGSDVEPRKYSQNFRIKNSSSSNSGWFSSEEQGVVNGETDTFLSLSSGSSASFRRNMSNSGPKTHQSRLKKGDSEMVRCSLEVPVGSNDTLSELGDPNTRMTRRRPAEAGGYSFVIDRKAEEETSEVLLASPNNKYSSDAADSCRRKTPKSSRETSKTRRRAGENSVNSEVGLLMSLTELYYDDSGSSSRKTAKNCRKTKGRRGSAEMGGRSAGKIEGRFGESYAVEKSSNVPYNDFRASMVEMIMEKQIFGAEDLERLLQCFLSLNSCCFHQVIIKAFTDICEVLFSN